MSYKLTKTVGPGAAPNTDSEWLRLDDWAGGQISFQTTVGGTVTYSILTTNDDPNDLINPVPVPTWDYALTGVASTSGNAFGVIEGIPAYVKILLLSGSGSVSLTVIQSEG